MCVCMYVYIYVYVCMYVCMYIAGDAGWRRYGNGRRRDGWRDGWRYGNGRRRDGWRRDGWPRWRRDGYDWTWNEWWFAVAASANFAKHGQRGSRHASKYGQRGARHEPANAVNECKQRKRRFCTCLCVYICTHACTNRQDAAQSTCARALMLHATVDS